MKSIAVWIGGALAMTALVLAPVYLDAYGLGLLIGIAGYVTLATAWSLFSGPTGYVSLATVAFVGVGAYCVAALSETLPYPVVLAIAAVVGLAIALVVGLSTLRLSGVYFVIFTFGLAELIRQLVTWYEINVTGTLGRYIFLPISPEQIYWQLLTLAALTLLLTWWVGRSRIGLALKVIGDDEVVASHVGINIARTKLALFAASAVIMTLVGAIQAPRWTYVEPAIVFNPTVSFLTLIMALGAVPLFLLFEWLSANFPNHYSILLGLLFIVIVYLLPKGVLARAEDLWSAATRRNPDRELRS